MILISHRGNTSGKCVELENTPSYIENALKLKFDVEIDVWFYNNCWWLGHDLPQYKIPYEFLTQNKLWIHCKNLFAFYRLHETNELNYFWHENDKAVLTSKSKIWLFIGQPITKNCICVLPELATYTMLELQACYGICSDFIENYKVLNEHSYSNGWSGY